MSEGLVKVSQRSVKCDRCGHRGSETGGDGLYWFERPQQGCRDGLPHSWDGRKFGSKCVICRTSKVVLCDQDGREHSVAAGTCAGRYVAKAEPIATPVAEPVAHPVASQDAESANLIQVLRDALGSSVNPEQVRAIVNETYADHKAELSALVDDLVAKVSVPTVVEVLDRKTFDAKDLGIAHHVFPKVFRAIQCGVHVWLVGPAGTGKTHIGHQCADGLGLDFGSISLTVTMPVSSIIGYMDANGVYRGTSFRRIWEHGGVFLFDEGDAGNANTWGVINEALSNGSMEFPDGRIAKHQDTYIICAANTYGTGADRQYVGRMQLDAATLDRFVHIEVPIDEAMESALGRAQGASQADMDWLIPQVRKIRSGAESLKLKVVISPRAIIFGAKLLAGGFTHDEVVSMAIRKGISDQDWARING